MAFVLALSRGFRVKIWAVALALSIEIICAGLFVWETQTGRVAVYRAEKRIAPAAAELMPRGARVAAGYPSTMVLYRPDIAVVTMPAGNEDLALLDEKVGLDAIVLVGGEIDPCGWFLDTLIVDNNTLLIYTRPR